MALISCKDCKKEFSTDAKRCPSCGAKPPSRTSACTWFIAVIFGIPMVAGIARSGSIPQQSPEQQIAMSNKENAQNALILKINSGAQEMKRHMRNPDSFKISDVAYNAPQDAVCYQYRTQNGFGGMNVESAILSAKKRWVYDSSQGYKATWNKLCGRAEIIDIRFISY